MIGKIKEFPERIIRNIKSIIIIILKPTIRCSLAQNCHSIQYIAMYVCTYTYKPDAPINEMTKKMKHKMSMMGPSNFCIWCITLYISHRKYTMYV